MATTYTYELTNEQQELLLGVMLTGNYLRREVPYALWSIEGDHFNAILYEKEKHGRRKLCVQGRGAEDFVLFVLEPKVLGGASLGYEEVLHPEDFAPHAGSDESGKGDYFGPLVVACVYTDETLSKRMKEIGARDCKQMSDRQVLAVGAQLRELLGRSGYATVMLRPPAYNRLYAKMKNINRMLAWAHATAIEDLLTKRPGCRRVVIDQFARSEDVILRALKPLGKAATIDQHHKAESDIAVAAASVIAREMFLREMMSMAGWTGGAGGTGGAKAAAPAGREEGAAPLGPPYMPIGSSDPRVRELAIEKVKEEGPNYLMNHCKAHFKTTDQVLEACGMTREALPPEGQVTNNDTGKFSG